MEKRKEDKNIPGEEFRKLMLAKVELVSRSLQEQAPYIERCAQLDDPVLILGPSGSGKEIVARVIHDLSHRRGKEFVPVNCGGIVDTLLQSELFGHKKGAFTDAKIKKVGAIAKAEGGTLFLDEIGDMPMPAQIALLRFLNDKKYQVLGDMGKDTDADVRIIAATNKDLRREINEGRFREDLFYRINVFPVSIPSIAPLNSRRLQTALNNLFPKFLREYAFDPTAYDLLLNYDYPGNYRELINIIKHAIVKCDGKVITKEHFPDDIKRKVHAGGDNDLLSLPADQFKAKINDLIFKKLDLELKEQGSKARAGKIFGWDINKFTRRFNDSGNGKFL